MRKEWTKDEEILLIAFIESNWLYKDIANELDRTFCSIQKKAMYIKIESPHRNNIKKKNISYVKEIPKDIELLEEYIDARTKILHKHMLCGHSWLAKPNNILNGKGCPFCCDYSFNPNNKGYTYLIYFKELNLYKVGITNNIQVRIKSFGSKPEIIFTREFELGSDARNLEKEWLNNIEHLKVNTGLLKSGNTETFKMR